MKRCPFCGKEIRAEAVKCRHCKRFLAERVGAPGAARAGERVGEAADPGRRAPGTEEGRAAAAGEAPAGRDERGVTGGGPGPRRDEGRPRPGQLAVLCPHCGSRFVEVAKRTWFLHGLILVARYGTRTHVGCLRCVNRLVGQNLVTCLVGGWWCFPWGLFTPLVVLQNLIAWLSGPPGALLDVLREAGIDPDEVLVDERGLTPGLRRFLEVAAAVLAAVVWSGGATGAAELRAGARILVAVSDGLIDEDEAERRIRDARGREPRVAELDGDGRAFLFRVAADAASADGALSADEVRVLHELGARLGMPASLVREILRRFYAHVEGARSPEADPEVLRACRILGVQPGAPAAEIRGRYRSLMMLHHPDRAAVTGKDAEAAHAAAREINWAYHVLMTAGDAR